MHHMKRLHLGNKPERFLHCQQCSKSFARERALKLHTMTHTGERPFTCLQCCKSFILSRSLVIHNRTHDKEELNIIKKHTKIVQTQLKYKCTLCFFSTRNKMLYRQHHQIHKLKSYKCPNCDMICSSVTSLLHHKRSKHPRTKMIEKCNICHQTVNISSHSHKEPNTKHVCSECNKKFASKINLKIHIRTHTKEKPYKCMKCNILFSQASGLSTHKLACNDIREVPCTLFLKKFRNESEKNRHIKTVHMKQRNFKCKLCRKAFSDLTPLKYHIKSAHGDGSDLFQCNICNKTITTKRNLIKHKNKFHKV